MTLPQIDVVQDGSDEDCNPELMNMIEAAVKHAVVTAKLSYDENAELSVLLSDDETLRNLNAQWRNIDKPTNVLSFPGEDLEPGDVGGMFLGDIVVSMETTRREAKLENKSFDDHFTHLIIHGFLHLFGYDHETEDQAFQMEGLETEILARLGIPDPYESDTR
ncbi:MAG: rRNA maturation RNase YbeY [Pseudomonadota bacterium]